jgi:hypothetical protein
MPRKKSTNTVTTATMETVSETVKKPPVDKTPKKKVLRKVPPTTLVPVMSNCHTPLIYNSRRQNGYVVEWDSYGVVEYMEVSELIAMRSSALRFYRDNWIVILDCDDGENPYTAEEIYNSIGVASFYKNAITPENIDKLLSKSSAAIKAAMEKLSMGARRTVYEYVCEKKESGEFDSIERFNVIQKMAGIDF